MFMGLYIIWKRGGVKTRNRGTRSLAMFEEEEHLTEPAPAHTLKGPDVESLTTPMEDSSIEVSPGPPPGSCLPSLPSWFGKKFVPFNDMTFEEEEDLTELASAQTLQGPNIVSLNTTLEESSIEVLPGAPSRSRLPLIPYWFMQEHDAFNDLMCELIFAQTVKEPDVESLATTFEESSSEVSPPLLSASPIRVRRVHDWGLAFHIRVDLEGSFHTYPRVAVWVAPFRV